MFQCETLTHAVCVVYVCAFDCRSRGALSEFLCCQAGFLRERCLRFSYVQERRDDSIGNAPITISVNLPKNEMFAVFARSLLITHAI